MNTRPWILASASTLVSFACGLFILAAVHAAALPAQTDPLLARLANVENIRHPYSWLLTGGQPDENALAMLAETGSWSVMDLRTPEEPRAFDEKRVVKTAGLEYLPIPTGSLDFSDARFTAFRHHLIAHGPEHPLFVHCGTGNRVGAALLPWLVLDQGLDEDLAMAMARDMGLQDAGITQRALEYIRARQLRTPSKR